MSIGSLLHKDWVGRARSVLSFAGSLACCGGSCSGPVELHILAHLLHDGPARIMSVGALDQLALQGLHGVVWKCSASLLQFAYFLLLSLRCSGS